MFFLYLLLFLAGVLTFKDDEKLYKGILALLFLALILGVYLFLSYSETPLKVSL